METLIDMLEEILILMGLVLFILCGFSISITHGLLFASISCLIGAGIVIKFKKIIANKGGD